MTRTWANCSAASWTSGTRWWTTSEARAEDFDNSAIFGADLSGDEPIRPAWLPGMDWQDTEALVALLAQKEYGGHAHLTPRSGDHGADVALLDAPVGNMVIQCKTSQNAFGDSNAAAAAHSAGAEYGKRFGGKCRAVLAVNAQDVRPAVRERAKDLDVEIWDRPVLEKLLNKHPTRYRELGDLLAQSRLERL